MIFGLSTVELAAASGGFLLVLVVGLLANRRWSRRRKEVEVAIDEYLEEHDDEPVSFKAPEIKASVLDVLRVTWHLQRARRLAKKGYVRWEVVGASVSHPKWVKPKRSGSGAPKVTVGGQPYYFPKEAMVTDELTGAWRAMHREGEADPINLRDPAYPGIDVDLMERIINLEAEDKPPGWLDGLGNWDQQTLMYAMIAVLFVIYALYQYLGGGL